MDQQVGDSLPKAMPDIGASLGLDRKGKSRSLARRLVWLAVAATLVGGSWYGYQRWAAAQAVSKSYTTADAARGDIIVEVSASGNLQPLTQVDVSSEQSGVVREVRFQENQSVKKGDVLAVLDTTTLSAQVERAEANVKASKARIADTEVTAKETRLAYDRAKNLAARGTLSQQELETAAAKRDRALSAINSAEADLAVAEADLKLQEAALAKSTIYAPIDGVILTRDVDPGQTVAASLSAPILFVIAEDLGRMKLEAAIDEADVGVVAEGQKAKFTVDAYSGLSFAASIREIAYASQTTENVVTYKANLDVDNSQLKLRPGMTANVDIIVREANGVLTIPNTAFRYQPAAAPRSTGFSLTSLFMPRFPRTQTKQAPKAAADGSRTVFVLEDGAPKAVQVMTGSTDGAMTEITSGLEAGAKIVTAESTAGAN
ncbi:MAG: efflux RND transporter periplasmic adaptor subunit [Rhizobiaceae bacterium]